MINNPRRICTYILSNASGFIILYVRISIIIAVLTLHGWKYDDARDFCFICQIATIGIN